MTSSAATTADVQPARTADEIEDEFFALHMPWFDPDASSGERRAYWQASAARSMRQAELLHEAAQLPEFPRSLSVWLVGYAGERLREHAERMTAAAGRGEAW